MPAILAFDLGTTYFKVCLFDEHGRLCALHRAAPPVSHTQEGWWELDPVGFRDILRSGVHSLRNQCGSLDHVAAVTFATQTNSFLLLDSNDAPLTAIILWPDKRAGEFAETMTQLAAVPGFRATTGLPTVGIEWMAAKLLWIHQHAPAVWARATRLCLISDEFTRWLTGRHVTEAGAAGLTGLLDIRRLRWQPAGLERLNLPLAWLAQPVRAGTDLGPIRPEVAAELDLPASCRFVVGCLDQYAGAIGAGNIMPGGVSETTGTVLSTVGCADTFLPNAPIDVFQGPAFDEGRYFHMCFGTTSAGMLEWYRGQLADRPDYSLLDAEAASVPPGCEGARARRGSMGMEVEFSDLTSRHTRGHAVRAIMEAVAFALAEQVGRLCGNRRPDAIRSSGGAARSPLWLQIKADVLGIPFAAGQCAEPTSLGAAMLAARALGWGPMDALANAWIRTSWTSTPDPAQHRLYRQLRAAAG